MLEKVKGERKLAEKLAQDRNTSQHDSLVFANADSDSEEEQFINEAILTASSSAKSKRDLIDIEKLRKGQSTEIIQCRTAIARRVLNVLDEKWPDKSELFMPGRMSHVISIDDEGEGEAVTTILRSKVDATSQDDLGPNESDFALDQLINIIGRIRQGKMVNDPKKKPKSWDRDEENDYGY